MSDMNSGKDPRDYFSGFAALGLPGGGISRDQEFFEDVARQSGKVVGEIEQMMGGDMPEHVKCFLYVALEVVAHNTGPQLTITFGDEAEEPTAQPGGL